MLEYNGIQMELVNIDRFEREAVQSQDGVDHLWNQYTIQVTAVVHYAYLNLGGGPFPTNNIIKEKLLEKRKKFKISFLTGGISAHDNQLGQDLRLFGAVDNPANPFVYQGPIPSEIQQFDDVPNVIETQQHGEAGEEELLIESPLPGATVDAKLGPEPLFCHITKFLGENGFVVTWAIRTWLVDCPGVPSNLSALLDNRFVMIHDVNEDQLTTVTTYGTAVFRTDLLLARNQLPDSFRHLILAPIYKGFRRQHIQVKQMSDTTIRYLTSDLQTPVVFNPSVDNAIRAEVLHRRVLAQKESFSSSIIGAAESWYSFRANRNWAQQSQKAEQQRADELHKANIEHLNVQTQNARIQQHQLLTRGGKP